MIRLVVVSARQFLPQARRLIRFHRRAADLVHQQAGYRQRLVAHHLRREPHARTARQQTVLRIFLQQLRRHLRRLSISRAHHDGLLHRLHVPAVAHELRRQPVQQFRIRRPLALRAEIFHGLHQPHAEIHLPEPVHRHARGQRVRRIHQPLRQPQTVVRQRPAGTAAARPARRAPLSRRAGRRRRAPARGSRAESRYPASPSRWESCRPAGRAARADRARSCARPVSLRGHIVRGNTSAASPPAPECAGRPAPARGWLTGSGTASTATSSGLRARRYTRTSAIWPRKRFSAPSPPPIRSGCFDVERLVHVVQIDFGPERPAIQVEVHSAGQPRAIVSESSRATTGSAARIPHSRGVRRRPASAAPGSRSDARPSVRGRSPFPRLHRSRG